MNHNIQTFKTNQHPVYTFSRKVFTEGMRDGFPIALGYFAVSFSLGIATRNAGLNPLQGFLASLLNNASAGEYAAFTLIAANATYLVMSCALAQRFSEDTPFIHRLFIAYDVTDKLFGITIARPGYLNPFSFKWNKDHSFDGDPVFCCCDSIPGHPGNR